MLPDFEAGTTTGVGDDSGPPAIGDESSDGAGEESSDGVPTAACGNGIIDGDDVCDGMDLGGETCVGLGFEIGELGCTANCGGFVLDGCGFFECGNGKEEGDEDCDGTVGEATCVDVGFDNGTLFCTMDCEYNDAMCGMCGDGDLDPAEECEEKLGLRETCESLDFDAGELACGRDCLYDVSGCQLCGNGAAEGTEVCDGDDFLGVTCKSLGLEGGELACSDTCGFDVSGCDIAGLPFGEDDYYTGLAMTIGSACEDITATGTDLGFGDDSTGSAVIGFNFEFYDTPFASVNIQANGTMNFGGGVQPGHLNQCAPYSGDGSSRLIKAFWDDLNPADDASAAVRYETVGDPGSQRFIVQWDAPFFLSNDPTNHIDVRVVLHEGTNEVNVCYVDTQGAAAEPGNSGAEASAGIQRNAATGIEFSCNTPDLVDGLQLTYLPL